MRLRIGIAGLLVVALLAMSGGSAVALSSDSSAPPTLVVDPEISPRAAATNLYIMGSGFEPGKPIYLLAQSVGGTAFPFPSITDITPEVKPALKVDEQGNFAAVWRQDRWATQLAAEGVYAIMAVDADYKLLVSVPFGVCDTAKPVTDWCKAKYPPPTPTPTPKPTPTPTPVVAK